MTNQEAKSELIKRYKYLNEHISFLLAPYVCEKPTIHLDVEEVMITILENFLLSEDKMEESLLYYIVEDLKTDREHLKAVEEGLALLEEKNKGSKYIKENLDLNNLLHIIGRYIDEQSGDLENKKNKLLVLDEYFRLLRYKNNGKIYTSGRQLDLHDCTSVSIPLQIQKPTRNPYDVGTLNNEFIRAIVNLPKYEYNKSIFTEEEKQEVYIQAHEELPYYLEITCDLEEEYIKTMIESRLYRPENTSPCYELFKIDKEQIFINPDDKLYRYYQLCPHCGYIVNIPKEIIPEHIKKEIEERCSKDQYLFRKQYLISELRSLDNKSIQRTLKK